MVLLYCFAGVIPLIIFFRCFRTFDKRIKKCRFVHAILSIITLIYDIAVVVLILNEKIEYRGDNYFVTIVPFVLCGIALLSYKAGTTKEKRIEAEIAAENSYDIMDLRKRNANNIKFQ